MKKIICISFIITGILLLHNCMIGCVVPSTKISTEARSVPEFNGVSLQINGTVTLHSGNPAPLTIRTNDNILPHLRTEVIGKSLVIRFDKCISGSPTIEIDATLPDLQLLEISGSGKIIGVDTFYGNEMAFRISGSGDIIARIDGGNVESRISGSGSITLSGQVDSQNITISGSGYLNGIDLISSGASVVISGSGTCKLDVSRKLVTRISGSGDVVYKGAPEVKSSISGSGNVRALPN